MRKGAILLLTVVAVLVIVFTMVPIRHYYASLTASGCQLPLSEIYPEPYEKGEDLLRQGRYGDARRLIEQGKAEARDSDEYYRFVVLEAKYFFALMESNGFQQCNRQLKAYLDRQTGQRTLQQQMLAVDYEMQCGVYETKMVGRMDSALTHHLKALSMVNSLPVQCLDCKLIILSNIADVYKQQGRYDQSVNYFREAMVLGDSIGMSSDTQITLTIGIASAYAAMGNFERSRVWWEQAARKKDEMQSAELFQYLNNRGNDYYLQDDFEHSLACFLELDSLMADDPNMLWERMYERANLSDVYIKLGHPERALPYLQQTEPFFTQQQQAIPLFYLTTQRIELALIGGRLNEALQLAHENPIPQWMIPEQQLLRQKVLMRLYEQAGDWKNYAAMQGSYIQLRDSIASSNVKMRFSEALMNYEHEKSMLESRNIIEEKELSFRWAIAMLAAAVIVIILLMVILAMKQRERKLREVEMRNHIVSMRMESVRNRITPHFISNALQAEMLAQMEGRPADLSALVQLLHRGIEFTDIEVCSLSEELEFIRFYCQVESHSVGDDFRLETSVDEAIDTSAVMLPSMFVQILVENAIKHGLKARRPEAGRLRVVKVSVTRQGQGTLVEVLDNGVGMTDINTERIGTGLRVVNQTISILNDRNSQKMVFSIANRPATDGETGCRASLFLPDEYDFTIVGGVKP